MLKAKIDMPLSCLVNIPALFRIVKHNRVTVKKPFPDPEDAVECEESATYMNGNYINVRESLNNCVEFN